MNLRPNEARSQDVWVDEANPDRNYDTGDGSELLVVRAGEGQRAWALIRFPLQDIPRNATLFEAQMHLVATSSDAGRTLNTWELREPWEEAQVNWTIAQELDRGLSPVNNRTTPCGGGGLGGGTPTCVFENEQEPPHDDDEDLEDEGITQSFRKFYRGEAPYHGHVIRDDGTTIPNLPQSQQFRSSSDLNTVTRRPLLVVEFDPNGPEIRSLLADGKQHVNASSTRRVNLSFEVFDRFGVIVNAWVNATTPEGKEVFNRSVFQNRSSVFLDVFRHKVWSNESLNLSDGQYTLNALALDTDGNINYTEFRQVNLTVENTPPFVNQSRDPDGSLVPFLSGTELDEGGAFSARVNASDASGILGVRLEVERGGEVLANLSFRASKVDANASGDWELVAKAEWAGFLNATIWVEDRAGNLNRSARIALHVRDVLPPVILDARVITPGRTSEGAIQEEGGLVAWEARVQDASPLAVTLELSTPAGAETILVQRQGLTDLYGYQRNFTQRGSYGAQLTARDLDGNTALRSNLGFFLLEARPPDIGQLRPEPDRWARGKATLSAVVTDLNLDASSILLEVRVPPAPFGRAEARTVTVSDTARRVEVEEEFFHGEQVEARVRASDLLGRGAERLWRFSVDDKPPATFLATEGPALAGDRTSVTGATTLRLERTDQGSGVLATVIAVVNEDRVLGTGNITIGGSEPAFLNLSASPVYTGTGNYTLSFSSVDVAGNVEPPQQKRLLVDDAAPAVSVEFEPGLLTALVQEKGTGVREVRAQYWLAPTGEQGSTLMSPNADKTVWQAQIPDGERGTRVLYAVEATDLMGNVGRAGTAASPLSSIIQNHRPLVTITPGNGSLVRGDVTITWAVTDKDGDAVQTSVAVRPSTSSEARELAPLRAAQGSVAWDTRGAGDGLWAIEVAARDGFETVVARSFVDVGNTDSKIVAVQVAAAQPGEPVRIEATLYKPVRRAEAVVVLGNDEVARVALQDTGEPPDRRGRDGVFTGQFTPERAGDYRVTLAVLFEDGKLESREQAAVAQVQWGFPARIVHDPLVFALVIIAPLALLGFWAYRRYGPVGPRR